MSSGLEMLRQFLHFLGSSKSLYGGIGSLGPGHDSGMSIRFSVCVAPDCALRNFNVFHAFLAASFFFIAFTLWLWLVVPIGVFLLMANWRCCSRSSLLNFSLALRLCFKEVYKSKACLWSDGNIISIPARSRRASKPVVSWFLLNRILLR